MNETVVGGGLQQALVIGRIYQLKSEDLIIIGKLAAIWKEGNGLWFKEVRQRQEESGATFGFSVDALNRIEIRHYETQTETKS